MKNVDPFLLLAFLIVALLLSGCGQQAAEIALDQEANFPPESDSPPKLPLANEPVVTSSSTAVPATKPPTSLLAAVKSTLEAATGVIVVPSPSPTSSPSPTPSPTPCSSPGQIVQGTYPSEAAGNSAYRVYLPPCYDPDGPAYPTLYMLPGNIYRDEVWDRLGIDEAAEKAINEGKITPFMIVMADSGTLLNNTSGGDWSYETQIVEDLIPFIEREYCAWAEPRGRAIGGMSRGGYWSLEIAFRHPDMFASVGGHSASLYDLYGGPDVIPQATGLANDLGELRIYFDIGESDGFLYNIRQLHEDMESAGIQHVWMLNEGRHNEAYWSSHIEEYLKWYAEPWPLAREAYPRCLREGENSSN